MQTSDSVIGIFTILISTMLILLFGGIIIYYLFLYQKKRFLHQKEMLELREAFNQTLLQSKLEIQEETLDHISKELHANFSQLVSLININLSEILPQSSDKMKDSVIETKSLAKQLLSELKALSASLNTDHIMQIGFINAFNNELGRLSKTKRFEVVFATTGDAYRLRPEHEIILFRLCQEVLNNVLKYSKATMVDATLTYTLTQLQIKISDNGVGFDLQVVEKERAEKESTGMVNIKKRAKLINATVEINSSIGHGTTVTIKIPHTN